MKLLSHDLYGHQDWPSFFQEHLPEQVLPNDQEGVVPPNNDTLLVLAQPAGTGKQSHYTPGRWWSMNMLDCLEQKGLHAYGRVRMLAMLPPGEMQFILPRSIADRMRTSCLTETVALHAVEIAKQYEEEEWPSLKDWDMILANNKRVAERTAAQHIIVPPGRGAPSPELAPSIPEPTIDRDLEYHPRIRTARHDRLLQDIAAAGAFDRKDSSKAAKTAKLLRGRAKAAFNTDVARCKQRDKLTRLQLDLDERMRDLACAAADSRSTQSKLEQLDSEIPSLQNELAEEISKTHFRQNRSWKRTLDDSRVASLSNNYDDSTLLWERRPFEPLWIDADEIYPRVTRSLIYFEPDKNPPALEKLRELSLDKRREAIALFDALALAMGSNDKVNLADIGESIFPGRSANDIVQSIPSLAPWAAKRLKPGCGPLPLPDSTLDPNECYQANLEYDLRDTRLRCLPIATIWDIVLEYQQRALDISVLQFTRLLGATVTTYRGGSHLANMTVR